MSGQRRRCFSNIAYVNMYRVDWDMETFAEMAIILTRVEEISIIYNALFNLITM